jgi:hypothetical protein
MTDGVDRRGELGEDPFDVASGDMEAVARRVEAFFDSTGDDSWRTRAETEIREGRTIPLEELARRKPECA